MKTCVDCGGTPYGPKADRCSPCFALRRRNEARARERIRRAERKAARPPRRCEMCAAEFDAVTTAKYCPACRQEAARRRYNKWLAKDGSAKKAKEWKTTWRASAGGGSFWLKQYGLTPETYAALLESQGGHCALCPQTDKLCVDHDHATGAVRGILCGRHNRAIGALGDTLADLEAVVTYLRQDPPEIAPEPPNACACGTELPLPATRQTYCPPCAKQRERDLEKLRRLTP